MRGQEATDDLREVGPRSRECGVPRVAICRRQRPHMRRGNGSTREIHKQALRGPVDLPARRDWNGLGGERTHVIEQRAITGTPLREASCVGRELLEGLLRRQPARPIPRPCQGVNQMPFPGRVAVVIHQDRRAQPRRKRISRIEALWHAAWKRRWTFDDLNRTRMRKQEGRRGRTEVRQGDRDAARVQEALPGEMLTGGRQRRVTQRAVNLTPLMATKHAVSVRSHRQHAGHVTRRVWHHPEPAVVRPPRPNGLEPGGFHGNIPSRRAARPGVAARIGCVQREPERGRFRPGSLDA